MRIGFRTFRLLISILELTEAKLEKQIQRLKEEDLQSK